MKIVVFGLSISSSWGNGHATLWRALCDGLGARGHRVVFFERDVPYYAATRDAVEFAGCDLRLYEDWPSVVAEATREVSDADVAMVTSYCPDGPAASDLALASNARIKIFYDLDTPVTLAQLDAGHAVAYLPPYGLGDFDLVLSYTGGVALHQLKQRLGARRVAALYGSVNPDVHCPSHRVPQFASDLSYIGTYAEDRQDALNRLFIEPARLLPSKRFVIAGAQYPPEFPWTDNIHFLRHLEPAQHPAFYCSSRATLNVTRRAMASMGFCPSGRLFEAAACGAPVISDAWEGISDFYEPGSEILLCNTAEDVLDALGRSDADLQRIAARARERTMQQHTAAHRAREFESIVEEVACSVQT